MARRSAASQAYHRRLAQGLAGGETRKQAISSARAVMLMHVGPRKRRSSARRRLPGFTRNPSSARARAAAPFVSKLGLGDRKGPRTKAPPRKTSGPSAAETLRRKRSAAARKGAATRRAYAEGVKLYNEQTRARRGAESRSARSVRAARTRIARRVKSGTYLHKKSKHRFKTPQGPYALKQRKRLQKRKSKKTGRSRWYYTKPYHARARKKSARRHKASKSRGVGRGRLRAITTIPAGARVAGLVRMNPRTGELEMARTGRIIVANPRRRRRRKSRTNPRRRNRRRNPRMIARNPSIGGLIQTAKSILPGQIAGAAGGLAGSFLDAKFFSRKPMLSILSKVVVGAAGAMMLRGKRDAAVGFAGGMMGSLGYAYGVKMFGGGVVAPTRGTALQGLAELASEDSEVAALLADSEDLADLVVAGDIADGELDESMLGDLVED